MKKYFCLFVALMIFLSFVCFAGAEEICVADGEILSVSADTDLGINARAYALMDVNTGTFIAGNNEHEMLYPASVTKIMTLLLVMEAISNGKLTLDMEVVCSQSAADKGGSQIWLEAGEVMSVDELLKATVVYSANDACCLLGEQVAGSEAAFCEMMNKRAVELGMKNTYFDNCTGLDDDTEKHKSTAFDIALMSCALLEYDLIKEYTLIWMDTLRNGATQLVNTNKMIRTYSGATGLKTGTTSKAGCCVSASAERDGLELVAVILGAENSKERFSAATELLDYGFANYEIYSPDSSDMYPDEIKISHGTKESVRLTHIECNDFLVNKGLRNSVSSIVELADEITAPVEKGMQVGVIKYSINDNLLGSTIITVDESVEKMSFSKAFISILKSVKKY